MRKKLLSLFLVFLSLPCYGQFKITSSAGAFHGVPLIQSALINFKGDEIPLTPLSYALAEKSFLDLFVVQLFLSDPHSLKENLLNLQTGEAIAIYMTFLMPLNKRTIRSHVKKILKNNHIDTNRKEIKKWLSVISVSVKKGDSFVIIGKKLSNSWELVEVKLPQTFFNIKGNGLIKDVFSLWLGDLSSQSHMQRMQNQLLENLY